HKADVLRLRGIAWFLNNQFDNAIATWREALKFADADACVAADLQLLISEACRRSGKSSEAVEAWKQTLQRALSLADPDLWERIIELKPSTTSWPDSIRAHFENSRWACCVSKTEE